MTQRERKDKRVALALTAEINERLITLAKVEGKPPAVVAREIVTDYLLSHANEISEAQKAADAYHASLKKIQDRRISLFDDEDN